MELKTILKSILSKLKSLGAATEDTGWVNITPTKGTWTYLKYRKIGETVNMRGHATAYTWAGAAGEKVAGLPTALTSKLPANIYFWGSCGGKRIAKMGIAPNGGLFLDSITYIPDGSNVTTSYWLNFNITYMLGGVLPRQAKIFIKRRCAICVTS